MFDDGYFEISSKSYKEDANLKNFVHQLPDIKLSGSYNENDDNELLKQVIPHCSETTKKLIIFHMKLNTLVEFSQRVFPLLSKITFYSCDINNESILRFNEWCPNLTHVLFQRNVYFSEAAYNTFTSAEQIFPQVKTFAFDFGYSMELTREFLAAMDKKFPSLESLNLTLDTNDNFSKYEPTFNVPYEQLYFKKLKKLSVFAYGEEVDQIFDYMAVSNTKLKELTFSGMTLPEKIHEWIESCKRLGKLTLHCSYLHEYLMNDLEDMEWLREVKLDVKQLCWQPKEMIKFVRKHQGLKLLSIESDRKNNDIKFDEDFKKLFEGLVQERGKLSIKVVFYQGRREMKISEKGFNEKCDKMSSDEDSDEDFDDDNEGGHNETSETG